MKTLSWWRRLLGRFRGPPREAPDPEAARSLFQGRYNALQLLLAANTRALKTMAAMEQVLRERTEISMSFVRSHCTAVGVNVFKMVRNLDILAPEKYTRLFERLEDIQGEIENELAAIPPPPNAPLVLSMSDIDTAHADVAGPKMATLGEVANVIALTVPSGFVITTSAYERLIAANDLKPEIERLLQTHQTDQLDELFILSSKLQQLVLSAKVPDDIVEAVNAAVAEIVDPAADTTFALRSSALGEDSAGASFAGQYESLLNVRPSSIVSSYLEVVASKYTPQAMQYRVRLGLRDDDVAMSVGCLEMVGARSGGVAYTGNPSDRADTDIFINSAWGLPKAIVDGRFASDLLVVRRGEPATIRSRTIGEKKHQFVLHPREGIRRASVAEDRRLESSIDDDQALAVAAAALTLEGHFGTPVDVEWAIDGEGEVVILQCRPLSQSAAAIARELPADAPDPLVTAGVNASPGAAAGVVHWVRRDVDALSFPDGAILALSQPLPRWAALLGRASAVVAEEGGVAGHLATVARELGIPAILGAGSLEGLEDGARVTVDATLRAVFPGRIEALLEGPIGCQAPGEDSPVRRSLRNALSHITPLNLVDPDGIDFRPGSCQTLHDITRFCHEQAVREIFAFGSDTPFPEYASKQLHHNVPMQWWVLDLGGGFTKTVTGKYVHLDDIANRPMLALWNGMIAVPWQGPPAVSGRGLASVLFQATANPALSSPFKKPYADRNYFIISENFLNLQSRFGFHFTNVEALAGPRPEENYLSFSFKGGAADVARKKARAKFIGGLLDEVGFEVKITEDVVTARRTGLGSCHIEKTLEVVGYLLMHTRQLDMVMNDSAAVHHYRTKMRTDIAGILAGASS